MDSMVVLLFASVIIIGLVLMVIMGLGKSRASRYLDKEKYQHDWMTIESSLTNTPQSQQFAILEADKLLDKALKERGFAGQTMGERMTAASRVFTRRDAVWAAHKLRNRIAHEHNVAINAGLTTKALGSFKRALKDLGAL